MRVAIVTPYFRECDELLRQCLESVAAQTYPCTHILVADGHPNEMVRARIAEHFILPRPHADNGNFARCVGALSAVSQGFEAVAFLDADNWYRPDHVASLVELQRSTGAAVCTSGRSLHRADGSVLMPVCVETDGKEFADTSTMFFHRAAFQLLPVWGLMPPALGPVGDRIIWRAVIERKLTRAHTHLPSLAFRTRYRTHYVRVGEAPPPGAKGRSDLQQANAFWNAMSPDERRQLVLGA
ncbi:MAG TPA: glycosyltransferase family A protein [Stellaceae bacterium]|nr:glycosyltransferase family A protein [Stellaceae bacterium]